MESQQYFYKVDTFFTDNNITVMFFSVECIYDAAIDSDFNL